MSSRATSPRVSTPTSLTASGLVISLVNTSAGFGGECHLDAVMVRSGLGRLPLDDLDLLVIENVGNLVCPAEFDVGEDAKAMVYAVTEGEDKPLKYPVMFRAVDVVVINKIDLLPHLDVDLDRFHDNLRDVNPHARTILASARTGTRRRRMVQLADRDRRRTGRPGSTSEPPRPSAASAASALAPSVSSAVTHTGGAAGSRQRERWILVGEQHQVGLEAQPPSPDTEGELAQPSRPTAGEQHGEEGDHPDEEQGDPEQPRAR